MNARDGVMPRWLPRLNKVVLNRIQGLWAWVLPPWAVVVHRGRTSGREYRTPVLAFRRGGRVAVILFYGDHTDWVRNLLTADQGGLVRAGRTHALTHPRVTHDADGLGPPLRQASRRFNLLIADLTPPT